MSRLITDCGLCGSTRLDLVLDLGFAPPPCVVRRELVASETLYPVRLLRCADCTLVQMGCVISPQIVFPPGYGYSSGNSGALHKNFEELAASVTVGPGDLVVDIGANDGTLLSKFGDCRKLGVEPTDQVLKLRAAGLHAIHAPFTSETAREILTASGPAKVITACNVLAHVENIHDVIDGISVLLAEDGVLVAENHDLAAVVDGGQWDTVYHEHLRFYSPHSFARLLATHGLYVQDVEEISTHGGSFRSYVTKTPPGIPIADRDYDFAALSESVRRHRLLLRSELAARNGRIMGVGAAARATTVIHCCGITRTDLQAVCEVPGSDKIGTFMPGTQIPVVDESVLFGEDQPQAVLLFSWHLADLITPGLRAKGFGGNVIVPAFAK